MKNIAPAIFLGHGSPMLAIAQNDYTDILMRLGEQLRSANNPAAMTIRGVVVLSAHWQTRGAWICSAERPATLYDFGGFPDVLYTLKYPCPGAPHEAEEWAHEFAEFGLKPTQDWGLDHGAWQLLLHMFPQADLAVVQISLAADQDLAWHVRFGQALRKLRERGWLIMGSGNIVHNLRQMNWAEEDGEPTSWAREFDQWVQEKVSQNDLDSLLNFKHLAPHAKLAVPTLEHLLPIYTILGAKFAGEAVQEFWPKFQHSTISLRGFLYGC